MIRITKESPIRVGDYVMVRCTAKIVYLVTKLHENGPGCQIQVVESPLHSNRDTINVSSSIFTVKLEDHEVIAVKLGGMGCLHNVK